jgi:hypothetical protein
MGNKDWEIVLALCSIVSGPYPGPENFPGLMYTIFPGSPVKNFSRTFLMGSWHSTRHPQKILAGVLYQIPAKESNIPAILAHRRKTPPPTTKSAPYRAHFAKIRPNRGAYNALRSPVLQFGGPFSPAPLPWSTPLLQTENSPRS